MTEQTITEQMITVQTERGQMPVHLTHPTDAPDAPLVVLFMDAPGIRPALHDHARRLTAAGYRTALPDLYYTLAADDLPRPERLSGGDPAEFERMAAAVRTLQDAEIIQDTAELLAVVDPGDRWACVGFCAGGRFGLRAATRFGGELAAAALLHPSRLVTDEPDSPHRELAGVTADLYLGFGENDHVTPLSVIPPLRDALDAQRVPHRIEIIDGADHGFTMPGMPAYNERAAERAWAGTLALLGERLPAGG